MAEVSARGISAPVLSVAIVPCPKGHHLAAVSLRGELDRSNEEEARRVIDRCLSRGASSLVVDLGGLTFMDSSGINLLVRTYNTLMQRHGRLALVAPPGPVRRILEIVRLSPRVPIYNSLQHALADLGVPAPRAEPPPRPADSLHRRG